VRTVNEADSGGRGLRVYRVTAQKATKAVPSATKARVYGLHVYNQDSTDTYLQLYDALTADVTVGTATPTVTLWIPALSGIDNVYPLPVEFNTGLVIAATTTVGGSTNPTNGLLLNLLYQA
jgi:hypothetical protein